MKIIRYGLRNINSETLLGFIAKDNGADEQGTEWQLENNPDDGRIWLVDTIEKAERAKTPTAWYNAGYETPSHDFNMGELEVVEVDIYFQVEY